MQSISRPLLIWALVLLALGTITVGQASEIPTLPADAVVDLAGIIDLQLARVRALLAARGLTLEVAPEAREFLVQEGYDPVFGARPLKRAIQQHIQNPVALAVLEGEFGEGDTVRVTRAADTNKLEFTKAAGPQPEPASVTDSYNRLVADVATDTRQAEINSLAQKRILDQTMARRESISGVNLDEEAANLVRYQQAYQAAAQVISTANTLFDTLLNAVRR